MQDHLLQKQGLGRGWAYLGLSSTTSMFFPNFT